MKLNLDGQSANNELKKNKIRKENIRNKDSRLKPRFFKPLSSVLIKPSGPDCNLDCDYCFYLQKAALFGETQKHRMSIETLEETIKQVMQQSGSYVTFGWQGGEPTLMGLDFFKKVIEFQQKYGRYNNLGGADNLKGADTLGDSNTLGGADTLGGANSFEGYKTLGGIKTIGNGLQTNGILIDKQWAQFLSKYNFLIGLSIDGPEHIHDHYRKNVSGKGSFHKVRAAAQILLENNVEVNALTVVNDYSVLYPEEIYNFHKSIGLAYQQYIPCVERDMSDPNSLASYSVSPKQFGEFLCKMFDLWINDFDGEMPTTSIRYFDSVFYNYVGMPAPECTLLAECGNYVVIEHTGDVYSCDFFVEPSWHLGNVHKGRIIDMLNSERQDEFGKMKSTLPQKCKECNYLKYCWGGCTKDRVNSNDPNKVSHFCESYLMFFEHADTRMKTMAANWKKNQ